jgi:hypothetical protein
VTLPNSSANPLPNPVFGREIRLLIGPQKSTQPIDINRFYRDEGAISERAKKIFPVLREVRELGRAFGLAGEFLKVHSQRRREATLSEPAALQF